MAEEMEKLEAVTKKTWPVIMAWIGGISALIGFFATIGGGVNRILQHKRHTAEHEARMQLAQGQATQGEYRAALSTYAELLKEDPADQPALDAQLVAAMQWVEGFGVYVRDGQNEADVAAPALDQILPVLTAGFVRSKGVEAADVEAHLGWAHWLNAQMAQRESGSIADSDLQAALKIDPSNVYAHAMTGFLQVKSRGELETATEHFHSAIATGRARPFVRTMQLSALIYLDQPGARAELIRVANDMRKNNETIAPSNRNRILAFCFDPVVTDHKELVESLSAVPNDEARETYEWLEGMAAVNDDDSRRLKDAFIDANLLELGGDRAGALGKYRELQKKLGKGYSSLGNAVIAGIARLSSTALNETKPMLGRVPVAA